MLVNGGRGGWEIYFNVFLTCELEGDEWLDSRSGSFIHKKATSLATKQMDSYDSGLSGKGRKMNILLCLQEIEMQLESRPFKIRNMFYILTLIAKRKFKKQGEKYFSVFRIIVHISVNWV